MPSISKGRFPSDYESPGYARRIEESNLGALTLLPLSKRAATPVGAILQESHKRPIGTLVPSNIRTYH